MIEPEATMPGIPPRLIETINLLVRTSQRMLLRLGRQPTLEELPDRVEMRLAQVERLLEIARAPAAAK
jgi:DNA-directed RNA polymerase sigma subunit (sigma70/sigma32)